MTLASGERVEFHCFRERITVDFSVNSASHITRQNTLCRSSGCDVPNAIVFSRSGGLSEGFLFTHTHFRRMLMNV